MRNALRTFASAIALLAAAFSFSCTQDMEGIFYSLEKEIKVPDNSLNNDISVVGVIKASFSGTPYYLAAAGSVFYRTTGETEWHKLKNPIGESVVTDIETSGANVLASFSNGAAHGVFQLDTAAAAPAYLPTNLYGTKQVFRLFQANGNIFASIGMTEAEAELLYFPGGAAPATQSNLPAGRWVRGITYRPANTSYYACTSTTVYTSTLPNGAWSAPGGMAPGVSPLRDIYFDGTNLYLSAKNYLLMSTNGTSWTTTVNNTSYDFTVWNMVNGVLLVGIDGSGYRHVDGSLNVSTPPGNFIRIPNFLYSAVISTMTDAGINNVFFGTAANGLWRGNYTNTADPSWSQE